MTRLPRWSVIGLLAVLALIGLFAQRPGRELTQTTFGVLPSAYGAMYDVLIALDVPVRRSYARSGALPVDAPVWWIGSPTLCRPLKAASSPRWEGAEWVQRGGTAVVFLPPPEMCAPVEALADLAVPGRTGDKQADKEEGASESSPGLHGFGGWYGNQAESEQVLTGALLPQPRSLRTPGLKAFATSKEWKVAAALDGAPFVLESKYGAGRLVVVSDARVLANAFLDQGDNALFAVDLVRTYGAPRIDERDHGLRATESSIRYLLTSPALPLILGLGLVGLLYAWSGHAVPARTLTENTIPPPTLATFVDSLATLYGTSRDYGRVLEAYRDFTLARLRRHFGLTVGTSVDTLLERLAAQRRVSAALLSALRESNPVADAAGLRRAVARLDRLAEEAMH